jgi:hypothetical protein
MSEGSTPPRRSHVPYVRRRSFGETFAMPARRQASARSRRAFGQARKSVPSAPPHAAPRSDVHHGSNNRARAGACARRNESKFRRRPRRSCGAAPPKGDKCAPEALVAVLSSATSLGPSTRRLSHCLHTPLIPGSVFDLFRRVAGRGGRALDLRSASLRTTRLVGTFCRRKKERPGRSARS